jgi:hypothetical protein
MAFYLKVKLGKNFADDMLYMTEKGCGA